MIGTVKALPMVSATINNPSITIGGERLIFPVKMESGMYLEFNSLSNCKLYGTKGEFLKEVKVEGTVPMITSGENKISFTCNGTEGVNSRVQVTVIAKGELLVERTRY